MGQIGHPNVVTLNVIHEDANTLYPVVKLCSGGRLIDDMSKNGCYSEHQAAELIKNLIATEKAKEYRQLVNDIC